MSSELTARAMEAMDIMQEECAEIIQIISKIRRFGLESVNPYDTVPYPNIYQFNDEVGDFEVMKQVLREEGILRDVLILNRVNTKREKLKKYSTLFSD